MPSVLFINLTIIRDSSLDHSASQPFAGIHCIFQAVLTWKGDYFNMHIFVWLSCLCIMVAWCCSLRNDIFLLSLYCPLWVEGYTPAFQLVINLLYSFIDLWISRPFLQNTHTAEGIGTFFSSFINLCFNNIQLCLQSLISSFILQNVSCGNYEFSLEPSLLLLI